MLPGFHGCHCPLAGGDYCAGKYLPLQVIALQQFAVVGIHVRDSELGRDTLRAGFVDVCDGHDLSAGDLLIVFEMMLASLSPRRSTPDEGSVF